MQEQHVFISSCLLLLIMLNSFSVADASSLGPNLVTLCKGGNVQLRTIDELNALADRIDSGADECPARVGEAIRDLKKLTDKNDGGVCTMNQAQAITQFVDNYLKDSVQTTETETQNKLPEPLVNFAIAYGMQVSRVCSNRMITNFTVEAKKRLSNADMAGRIYFKWLTEYLSDDGTVGTVLGPIIKTGELILPVDLMQAVPGMAERVGLLVPQKLGVERLKNLCQRVLQPLYEPVLLPLAHLIRAGFNNKEFYQHRQLQRDSQLWSRIVFVCETLKVVKLDEKQPAETSDGDEAGIVSDMKQALQGLEGKPDDISLDDEDPRRYVLDETPIYTDNTIFGRSVQSLVKGFDANKNHVELLRKRILDRSFRIFWRLFKRNGFSAVKNALMSIRPQPGSEDKLEKARNELLSLMQKRTGDSLAYTLLVSLPKIAADLIALIILTLVFFVPATPVMWAGPEEWSEKYMATVMDFPNNRLHVL